MSPPRRVTFDTETHRVQPGLNAPPLVVAAIKDGEDIARLYTQEEAAEKFLDLVEDPDVELENTFISYDLGVMSANDPACIDGIFRKLDEGKVFDTTLMEALHDNARGLLFREANGTPFMRYSQLLLENRYLQVDRSEQKEGDDAWRLRYHELDGIPLEQWPEDARQYPLNDVRYAQDVAEIQRFAPGRQNLQCHADEMRFAYAAYLATMWGIRTERLLVEKVVGGIEAEHEASRRKFFDVGITRVRPVAKKKGEYEEADDIDQTWLDQALIHLAQIHARSEGTVQPWIARRMDDLKKASGALKKGRGVRFATDTARLKELVTAAYQGEPPATAGGDISTSNDTLTESGNELLESYGEAGENEKLFSTYRRVLRLGTEVPVCAEINTFIATQRCSMRQPNLQQVPQKNNIRECFIARGYEYE